MLQNWGKKTPKGQIVPISRAHSVCVERGRMGQGTYRPLLAGPWLLAGMALRLEGGRWGFSSHPLGCGHPTLSLARALLFAFLASPFFGGCGPYLCFTTLLTFPSLN